MLSKKNIEAIAGTARDEVELRLLNGNYYLLSGEISHETVDDCIKWIVAANISNTTDHLKLLINSTGGDLYCALALIDIIRASKLPIATFAIGAAMSAAFLIFAAGTKGKRSSLPHTVFMIHQHHGSVEGKHHDIKATMKESDMLNQLMVSTLVHATNMNPAKVRSKLLPPSDVFLTPEEAVEYGIVDNIVESIWT